MISPYFLLFTAPTHQFQLFVKGEKTVLHQKYLSTDFLYGGSFKTTPQQVLGTGRYSGTENQLSEAMPWGSD